MRALPFDFARDTSSAAVSAAASRPPSADDGAQATPLPSVRAHAVRAVVSMPSTTTSIDNARARATMSRKRRSAASSAGTRRIEAPDTTIRLGGGSHGMASAVATPLGMNS